MNKGTCRLRDILEAFPLEVVYLNDEDLNKPITKAGLNRPGLELTGYFAGADIDLPVLLDEREISYLKTLSSVKREEVFDFLTGEKTPYILLSSGVECPEGLFEICRKKKFPLLRSEKSAVELIGRLFLFTSKKLARQETFHGTLLDVYGIGVLTFGKSGVGKSETALELIKKGHRLVADDSVIVRDLFGQLRGEAPRHLRNLLEVRGIGVIDVFKIYGVASVLETKAVNLAAELIPRDKMNGDRLTGEPQFINLLGRDVPLTRIPVGPGGGAAGLVEAAVADFKLKSQGYDAGKNLFHAHDVLVARKGDQ